METTVLGLQEYNKHPELLDILRLIGTSPGINNKLCKTDSYDLLY
jgi:hypothetical protein